MEDLHENLDAFKEKEAAQPKPTIRQRIAGLFKRKNTPTE